MLNLKKHRHSPRQHGCASRALWNEIREGGTVHWRLTRYSPSLKLLVKENHLIMKTAHYIRQALLNSRLLLVASILAFLAKPAVKAWSIDDSSAASDKPTIPQTPVEYVGHVDLTLKGQVELAFDEDTPAISDVNWMGFSPEGTLLLSDFIGRQAFEFSIMDGQYIRSIGRSGLGPGEYGFPFNIAITLQGHLYILDKSAGYLHRYDRQGQFLDRSPRFSNSGGVQLVTGRDSAVYLTKITEKSSGHTNTIELQRLEPATSANYEPIYRIPLSTNQPSFIADGNALAYSPTRHQLYYMGRNDYKVTEIDPATGQLVRQFGYQLERYRPLPERYYSSAVTVKTFEEISNLDHEASWVESMILVQDQYIFVTYQHPSIYDDLAKHALKWEGVVYDLKIPNQIKAYTFEKAVQSSPGSVLWFLGSNLTHWDGCLYTYQSPLPERANDSNGTVVIYEPVFQLH